VERIRRPPPFFCYRKKNRERERKAAPRSTKASGRACLWRALIGGRPLRVSSASCRMSAGIRRPYVRPEYVDAVVARGTNQSTLRRLCTPDASMAVARTLCALQPEPAACGMHARTHAPAGRTAGVRRAERESHARRPVLSGWVGTGPCDTSSWFPNPKNFQPQRRRSQYLVLARSYCKQQPWRCFSRSPSPLPVQLQRDRADEDSGLVA